MQIPLISLPFCLFRGRVIQHPCIGYIVSPRQILHLRFRAQRDGNMSFL